MGVFIKARVDATRSAPELSQPPRMLEACTSLLEDRLDSLKRNEPNTRNMKLVCCKVADTEGSMKGFVGCLRRDTLRWYGTIRHSVDQSLLAVSNRLKGISDC